jgi:branched-chain amino acid transport system ATP-binding protein
VLKVSGLKVVLDGVEAVKDVSFEVGRGRIVALLGANGAGKTTTLRALSGLEAPQAGRVLFKGMDITRLPPHRRVALGLCHVPEGRRIFPALTVKENLELAGWTRGARETAAGVAEALELFPGLARRLGQAGGTLSGGEQQMLALGRAVVTGGELLMLDEPSMGLSPRLVEEVFGGIQAMNARGTTLLLVEQNAAEALAIAQDACVLELGRTHLSGPSGEVARAPGIREAYLGV